MEDQELWIFGYGSLVSQTITPIAAQGRVSLFQGLEEQRL